MKDHIRELVDPSLPRMTNEFRIREYLQEYSLYILHHTKIYRDILFCGGTALRFLFKLKRFSEDLDFSAAREIDFEDILKILKREFEAAGYDMSVKYKTHSNVNSAFIKFPGLLNEAGLSGHAPERLSLKFEIDTRPPAGGTAETTPLSRTFMFHVQHFDLSSLFAGKLHAAFTRAYTKGRDWYDLLWYLTAFPDLTPNLEMLNNALLQTDPEHAHVTADTWKPWLLAKSKTTDLAKAAEDVLRFLEIPSEADLISQETFQKLLTEKE
ncbi:nucleotidyl transferase AbiEii/AbiGii toxin family protein [Planctomycetota bacterium]